MESMTNLVIPRHFVHIILHRAVIVPWNVSRWVAEEFSQLARLFDRLNLVIWRLATSDSFYGLAR